MRLLFDEMRPGARATDPDTPLILLAGPLAGTSAPGASSLTVVTLNHDMSGPAATDRSGGYWAAYLKHAGYDGIVVTGRAARPVFLSVTDEDVAIRDATAYWGLDTRETERLIKRCLYDQPRLSVACIGPAGEAMLPGASIRNDWNHGAHTGGVGAVMGSKRLKAIAVSGSKPVPLGSPIGFYAVTRRWSEAIDNESNSLGAVARRTIGLPDSGCVSEGQSQALLGKALAAASSTRVFRKRFEDAAADSWTVVPKGCFNCVTSCAYDCHVNEGEFARTTASICGCSESVGDAAAMLGIEDPSAAIALAGHFHAVGIDPALAGTVMARVFQLFKSGILSLEDTDGLELNPGSFDAATGLLNQIVDGRGLGRAAFGKGLRAMVTRILATTPEAWLESADGDVGTISDEINPGSIARGRSGSNALRGQRVAERRPKGREGDPIRLMSRPSRGGSGEPLSRTHKQALWEDCLGVCLSACQGVKDVLDYSAQALACATGWADFSPEEAIRVGERVAALNQLFVSRHGRGRQSKSPMSELSYSRRTASVCSDSLIALRWVRPAHTNLEPMCPSPNAGMSSSNISGRLGLDRPLKPSLVPTSNHPHAGSYSLSGARSRKTGGFDARKVRVTCPTCGRRFAALLSLYTRNVDGHGEAVGRISTCATFQSNCRQCGTSFTFDLHP